MSVSTWTTSSSQETFAALSGPAGLQVPLHKEAPPDRTLGRGLLIYALVAVGTFPSEQLLQLSLREHGF